MRTITDNFWLDTPYEAGPALWGDREADVAVVGGGFTGLAAACFITQRFPEKSVVVLESEFIGYGSSGRNSGLTSSMLGHNVIPIKKSQGTENTRRFHKLAIESITLVEELVREYNIDCDYEKTGRLDIAESEKEVKLLERKAKAYEEVGAEVTWLDRAEARSRFQGTEALAALHSPDDRTFNPVKLLRGLKKIVESLGVEIYEHSRCTRIEPGPTISLYTAAGRVRARDIVVGTNAYSNPLGLLRYKVLPFYVYNTATEPLSRSQMDALGWAGREPVFGQKYLFWTIRITADNRIVFNDADALYFRNIERDYSHRPKVHARQHKFLTKKFPFLKGIKVTHQWGGRVGITLDFLPSVGCKGKHGNIYYSMGYNGHGVAFASLAGKMIAELMAGEKTKLTDHALINKSVWGVPSPSLTYLASNGYKMYFKLYDRWLDIGK